MKTTITAKNMIVTPAITQRIMKKTKAMERYLTPETEMYLRLAKEFPNRRVVEITVPMNGVTLRAEASNDDNLFLSIDQALTKLEKQIQRHRTKLEKRLRTDAFAIAEPEYTDDVAPEEEDRQVVKQKTYTTRPMSLEEAKMQMDLLGHSFFVFVSSETGNVNVLYQRVDGNLGLLEPDA